MALTIKRPKRRIEIASINPMGLRLSGFPSRRELWKGPQTARAVKVELHRVRQSGRIACAVIDGTVVLDQMLEGWLS